MARMPVEPFIKRQSLWVAVDPKTDVRYLALNSPPLLSHEADIEQAVATDLPFLCKEGRRVSDLEAEFPILE